MSVCHTECECVRECSSGGALCVEDVCVFVSKEEMTDCFSFHPSLPPSLPPYLPSFPNKRPIALCAAASAAASCSLLFMVDSL